ncbi:MAG: hypothetical protein ACI4AK_01310 [Lepagella sp.]
MYRLSLHIEYLLGRHDCVIVPGVGAFINVRHAARYDRDRRIWHAMSREIRFNGAVKEDDGLVANSYARREETGYEEGRRMMQQDIDMMMQLMERDGEVSIGRLGILKNQDGRPVFRPSLTPAQLSREMGYTTISMAPYFVQSESEPTASASVSVAAETPEEKVGTESGRKFDTRKNYYIAINKKFARMAACVAAIALLALSVVLPVSDSKQEDRASVVPVEKIITATCKMANQVAPKPTATTTSAAATEAPTESVATAEAMVTEDGGRYHLIVATFNTHQEAEKYVSYNATAEYPLTIISTSTKSRVSVKSSDDRAELVQTMHQKGIKERFSEPWIWEK